MRFAALAFAALPVAALAQIANPAFMSPTTQFESPGLPAPDQTNTTDLLFAQLAAEGGLAEVVLGELAVARAGDPAVGDFASRMVNDHKGVNERLTAIADKVGIPLPDALNPDHAAIRDQLEDAEGTAFDLTYMRSQVVDHQKTVQLLTWEVGQGQNAELQRFAAETLPAVLDHLSMARTTVSKLVHEQIAKAEPSPASR